MEDHIIYPQFERALIGYVEQFGKPLIALYDRQQIMEILQEDGMTEEEAWEWYDFNILGGYLGETTPVFFVSKEEVDE